MPTVLVTGAARGLGFEFARQYAADGWRVIATVRAPEAGAKLAALGKSVEVHLLDVTDPAAAARLARDLNGQAIDVLLCNAGIYGPRDKQSVGTVDWDAWGQVMRTNVMGPMALAGAFADHVAASDRRLIVMVSSQMGSMGAGGSGGAYIYRSSKAALNAIAKNLSADLAARGIAVIAVHPGWVRTDMGGAGASLTPERSVRDLRAVFAKLGRGDSGKFFNHDGSEIPW